MTRDRTVPLSVAVMALAGSAVCLYVLHHPVAAAAAVTTATFAILVAAAIRSVRHRKLSRGLLSLSAPESFSGIGVRTGDFDDAAFVAGLRRPTIFCDRALPRQLAIGELRAVLLHERAHQRAGDPARLLLLEVVAPIAQWLPFGRQWLAWSLARREIDADQYALSRGATREEIASALLRLPPLAQAHVAGFTAAVDLRLRALLGEDVATVVPLAVRRASIMLPMVSLAVASAAFLTHKQLGAALGHVCC